MQYHAIIITDNDAYGTLCARWYFNFTSEVEPLIWC
jgi:hypothetical protein